MPCPYFEPRQAVTEPSKPNARVPLIDEYDGLCRATQDALPVDPSLRMRLCNHGNACGVCARFPRNDERSAFRYEMERRSATQLELLFIEESRYAPLRWHRHCFKIESEQFEPEINETCQRAQLLAFCRSYLRRHPN